MSNVHRFKPKPKAPPPRRPLPWARSAWLPWLLVVAGAALLALLGLGGTATAIVSLLIVLAGAWAERNA